MKNFNQVIDDLFSYAMKHKKRSPKREDIHQYHFQKSTEEYDEWDGWETFMDRRHNHVCYKIDTMPQDAEHADFSEKLPLRYSTTRLSKSGVLQVVTRIQLYVSSDEKKCTLVATLENDQNKKIIHFKPGNGFSLFKEDQILPKNMLRGIAQFDATFHRMGYSLDWTRRNEDSWSNLNSKYDSIYTDSMIEEYKKIHEEVQNEVLRFVSLYLKNASHSRRLRLNLIDVACGKLGFVKNLSEAIHQHFPGQVEIQRVGFDLLYENIAHTRQQDPKGSYVVADLAEPDKVIQMARQSGKLFDYEEKAEDELKTIVVATGALTRLVLKSTFSCVESLQSFSRGGVDAIFCSGKQEPLFPSIVKRVGMAMETNDRGLNTIYLLKPLPLDAVLHQKMLSFQKHKPVLDLSLSSNPLYILKNFPDEYRSEVEILDLSFSFINNMRLIPLLVLYPNLKKVISYQDNKLKKNEIEFSAKQWPVSIELISELVGNEIFLMSANARERVFGLYDKTFNLALQGCQKKGASSQKSNNLFRSLSAIPAYFRNRNHATLWGKIPHKEELDLPNYQKQLREPQQSQKPVLILNGASQEKNPSELMLMTSSEHKESPVLEENFQRQCPVSQEIGENDAIPEALIREIQMLRADLDDEAKNMSGGCSSFFSSYKLTTKQEKYNCLTSMLQAQTLTELKGMAIEAKKNDRVMRSIFSSRVKSVIEDIINSRGSIALGKVAY